MDPADLADLHTVTLTGPAGTARLDRDEPGPRATLVLDESTGRIRGLLRGDDAVPTSLPTGSSVRVSRGIPDLDAGGRRE